jgi:hypothetical protein
MEVTSFCFVMLSLSKHKTKRIYTPVRAKRQAIFIIVNIKSLSTLYSILDTKK